MRELQAACAVLLAVAARAIALPSGGARCAANNALLAGYRARGEPGAPGPDPPAHSYLSQLAYGALARAWPESCWLKILFSSLLQLGATAYFLSKFLAGGAGTASLAYYGRRKAALVTARVLQAYLCVAASPLSRSVLDPFDPLSSLKFALYLLDLDLLLSFHFILASLVSTLLLLLDGDFLPLACVHAWVCLGYVLAGALGGGPAGPRARGAPADRRGGRGTPAAARPRPRRARRSRHRASLLLTAFVRLASIALLQLWVVLLTLAPWLASCTADRRIAETWALLASHLRGSLERILGGPSGPGAGVSGALTASGGVGVPAGPGAGIWATLRNGRAALATLGFGAGEAEAGLSLAGDALGLVAGPAPGQEPGLLPAPVPAPGLAPALAASATQSPGTGELLLRAGLLLLRDGHLGIWVLSDLPLSLLFVLPNVIRNLVEYDSLFRFYFPLVLAYRFLSFYLLSPLASPAQLYYGLVALFVAVMCRLQQSLSYDEGRALFSQFSTDISLSRPRRLPARSTHLCVPVRRCLPGLGAPPQAEGLVGGTPGAPLLCCSPGGPLPAAGAEGAQAGAGAPAAASPDALLPPLRGPAPLGPEGGCLRLARSEFNNLHEVYHLGPEICVLRSLRGPERARAEARLQELRRAREEERQRERRLERSQRSQRSRRGSGRATGSEAGSRAASSAGSSAGSTAGSNAGSTAGNGADSKLGDHARANADGGTGRGTGPPRPADTSDDSPPAGTRPPRRALGATSALTAQLISGSDSDGAGPADALSTSDESFTSQDEVDLAAWIGQLWLRWMGKLVSTVFFVKDSLSVTAEALVQVDMVVNSAAYLALVAACCSLGASDREALRDAALAPEGPGSLAGLFSPAPLTGPEALPWILLDVGSLAFISVLFVMISRDKPIPSMARSTAVVLFCLRAVYLVEGLFSFDLRRIRFWSSAACTFALHVVRSLLVLSLLVSKQGGA